MNRRGVFFVAAAVSAGAGGAFWYSQRKSPQADLWSLHFERPDGGELAMAQWRGKRLLVNFWATWCGPCLTEMPLLDRFHRDQSARGWAVVGLAVDQAAPVREFLHRRPVGFDIALAGLDGVDLSRKLGNASGALPFTVVFDTDGQLLHRKLGVLDPGDLQRWSTTLA